MKAAGVPVELRVAANLRAMCPALPMPAAKTLPRQAAIASTAHTKSSVTSTERMASASARSTARMRSAGFMPRMVSREQRKANLGQPGRRRLDPQSPDKDRPDRCRRPLGPRASSPQAGRPCSQAAGLRKSRNHAIAGKKPCTVRLATRSNDSLSGDWGGLTEIS